MAWQLAIDGPSPQGDTLESLLESRGARVELGDGSRLIASFDEHPDLIIIDAVGAWLTNLGLQDAPLHTRTKSADPWQEGWRAIFQSFQVSKRLWVTPSWDDPLPAGADTTSIIIDPTQAFGAGAHPTTAAVLEMLDRCLHTMDHAKVLDVGSGTGILAIAAIKLGAHAVGVEIDPVACEDSIRNAELNGVADRFEVHVGSVEKVDQVFDVVVANVYGSVLEKLATPIMTACSRELILSGMMSHKADGVLAAYDSLRLKERVDDRGWTTAWLTRNDAS